MYLIIFCPYTIDYCVASDVISQYYMFDNAKHIFNNHNIVVKYFWDFLEKNIREKIINFERNINKDYDLLNYYSIALNLILQDNEYNNSIFHCWEICGIDALMCDIQRIKDKYIKICFSIYDPHSFHIIKGGSCLDSPHLHNINDERLDCTDAIISSSHIYYENIQSKYSQKSSFISFSFNNKVNGLFNIQDFDNWYKRSPYIYLIGACNEAYRLRIYMWHFIRTSDDNTTKFRNIIKIPPFIKYNRDNYNLQEHNFERGGIKYLKNISNYMAVFICFGTNPIDFPLAKIWEAMLAGCLCFIEPKEYLIQDLGLIAFIHYVPILLDSNNNMIIDNVEYYTNYLNSLGGFKIAKEGFEYIKNNFTDEKIAEKYCNILLNNKLI